MIDLTDGAKLAAKLREALDAAAKRREALEAAGFEQLANEGNAGDIEAIRQPLVEAAVESSMEHMRTLGKQHVDRLLPYLRREERRLRDWKNRRQELL